MTHSVKMSQMSPNAFLSNGQLHVENIFFYFNFTFSHLYLHSEPLEHLFLGNQATCMKTTIL